MRTAIQACDPAEIRNRLWENIVLTGGCSLIPGLQERLQHELTPCLAHSENAGDTQGHDVKFLKIPDYFTVLREGRWQGCKAWLGGEIVAKVSLASRFFFFFSLPLSIDRLWESC